jgi:hypothetical protein
VISSPSIAAEVEAYIGSWGETNPTLDIRNCDESSTPFPYWWTNACWSVIPPFSRGKPSAADSMTGPTHLALVRVQSVVGDRCLGHG